MTHFDRYKISKDTPGMSTEQLDYIDQEIWEDIHDLDEVRAGNEWCEQFFKNGGVERGGYYFTMNDEDEKHILVCHTNWSATDFEWGERVVPSLDPEVVRAYILAFEGDEVVWTPLIQSEIHTA